jgi:uncharacterized phage-associated protein
MPVSARDVAAVLRKRLPGLPTKKLHKLLYYCQGHHLATFDQPLFSETISAWDMGPVVGTLWRQERLRRQEKLRCQERQGQAPPTDELDEAQLNTIGYVLSRYGALTGRDLETLTHREAPWQQAARGRRPGESARIEPEWIREYFRTSGSPEDAPDVRVDPAAVTRWLQHAGVRRTGPARPDNREELLARLCSRA